MTGILEHGNDTSPARTPGAHAGTGEGGTHRSGATGRHRRPGRSRVKAAVMVVLALVIAGGLVAVVTGRAAGWRTYVVQSGSMGRTAPVGSVVEMRPIPAGAVAVGDIVLLQHGRTPVMHRVIERTSVNGTVMVRTKGDANRVPDPQSYPVPPTALTPAVIVPWLGYPTAMLHSTEGACILVALAGLLLIAAALRKRPEREQA